jgi:hypothetical protein
MVNYDLNELIAKKFFLAGLQPLGRIFVPGLLQFGCGSSTFRYTQPSILAWNVPIGLADIRPGTFKRRLERMLSKAFLSFQKKLS